jgi:uncharacterized membrane protein
MIALDVIVLGLLWFLSGLLCGVWFICLDYKAFHEQYAYVWNRYSISGALLNNWALISLVAIATGPLAGVVVIMSYIRGRKWY